ncbi:HNH endonuclease signature motif containing protein [Ruania halotolerans]|uniref:HNH endonuclease signature motif containing protein n=1 Tax=Ruania halotolerans TaxID=2897773 RepID=UPI001E320241|nr:HNH endonuclease signature motif containing protein [Ruania halotolerans]UFU05281.1 HNH endonuclease [Ruania halotolerans]
MTTTAPWIPMAGRGPRGPRAPREGVLMSLRRAREAASAWEVESARLVVDWVRGHCVDGARTDAFADHVVDLDEPVVRPALAGLHSPMRLAGPGAPLVWDLAFCELATTLSMSGDAARAYVGEVTELAFRLPMLWDRVNAGQVRLWRAREVARSTTALPADGAAWVDAQLAPVIGSCSGAQVQRAVDAALDQFDPEAAEARRRRSEERLGFDIRLGDTTNPDLPGSRSTTMVEGELDTADAIDLDAAVSASAAQLSAWGSTESRDVRRARAVGEIARRELMLPVPAEGEAAPAEGEAAPAEGEAAPSGGETAPAGGEAAHQDEHPRGEIDRRHGQNCDGATPPATITHNRPADPGRRVVLVVHLSADALDPDAAGKNSGALGRCENTRSPVTAEQIRSWCGTSGTRILVRPVVDLAGHYPSEAYESPPRLREQVITRDPQCVFPSCTRRARGCDLDHIVPFEDGGPTCGCNLAPLCRRHHRAKTRASWSYVMVTPGTYLWTSPSGEQHLVDGRGTFRVPSGPTPCGHTSHRDRPDPPPWPRAATGPDPGSGPRRSLNTLIAEGADAAIEARGTHRHACGPAGGGGETGGSVRGSAVSSSAVAGSVVSGSAPTGLVTTDADPPPF